MQVLDKDNIVAVTGGMSNADIAETTGVVLEGAMGLFLSTILIASAIENKELALLHAVVLVGGFGMVGDACFRAYQLIDAA